MKRQPAGCAAIKLLNIWGDGLPLSREEKRSNPAACLPREIRTMSVADQLLAGLQLTLTGMVTVFLLLTFMVLAIGWMSKLAHRLSPPAKPVPMGMMIDGPPGSVNPAHISAITAAIHRYRNTRH